MAGGRPRARRRCFVCGLASDNGLGIPVAACQLSRGRWRMTVAGHRRQMIGTSLSIGLCVRCLEEALHDGRIHRSPTMLSTMAVSDQPAAR